MIVRCRRRHEEFGAVCLAENEVSNEAKIKECVEVASELQYLLSLKTWCIAMCVSMTERNSNKQARRGTETTKPTRRHNSSLSPLVHLCQYHHCHMGV